jgi:hypothetical protein
MAVGTGHDVGIAAPADVAGAGDFEWANTAGIPPTHPLVGGPSWGEGEPNTILSAGHSRIVTTPEGAAGPAMAPGAMVSEGWRDLFNFKGSPTPWLLVGALAVLGFMQFRVMTRVGPAKASAALG